MNSIFSFYTSIAFSSKRGMFTKVENVDEVLKSHPEGTVICNQVEFDLHETN